MSSTSASPSIVYVQLPDVTPRRVLHPCTIEDREGVNWTLETTEVLGSLRIDSTVLVYFDDRQTFMQQPARVRGVETIEDGEGVVLTLERLGEPVDAEQRQVYRVSCVTVPISAKMNTEPGCKIVDISATGFGVHCASHFHIGETVTATVDWDGEAFTGPVAVVSVRQISDTHQRYGVRSIDTGNRPGVTLKKSLTRISLAVQREQMRRIR
ncbi:MAG: PilZ domain-containing protein [Myxococcota bacterium]